MKTHMNRFVMVLGIGMITSLAGTSAYGIDVWLVADNVDINLTNSWALPGGGDTAAAGRRGYIHNGYTGYLDSTYVDEDPNKPHSTTFWNINTGHLILTNGASLTLSGGNDLKISGTTETTATMTMHPGSFFENTVELDHSGLTIGVESTKGGTFIVNNGGTVGAKTDVAVGRTGLLGNTADCVGVFKVIGDGGSISNDQFKVSRFSRVEFELDDTGISPINVGNKLTIWTNATTGLAGGKLIVDTSALAGGYTVTLFNYVDLATGSDGFYGTIPAGNDRFGTVTVTGPEPYTNLVAGTGSDPGTYLLDYGSGTSDSITLTYRNQDPAGSLLFVE
jgi:hypothetical protein